MSTSPKIALQHGEDCFITHSSAITQSVIFWICEVRSIGAAIFFIPNVFFHRAVIALNFSYCASFLIFRFHGIYVDNPLIYER